MITKYPLYTYPLSWRLIRTIERKLLTPVVILSSFLVLALSQSAQASVAWGSINNFDTVNDTGPAGQSL